MIGRPGFVGRRGHFTPSRLTQLTLLPKVPMARFKIRTAMGQHASRFDDGIGKDPAGSSEERGSNHHSNTLTSAVTERPVRSLQRPPSPRSLADDLQGAFLGTAAC
jgi:hypothetical protein